MRAEVAAIIPAAGVGKRLGGTTPKPFVLLGGEPLLAHVLNALQRSRAIRWIVPVVRAEDAARLERLIQRHQITKALPPCLGGPSRAASVARGFAALPPEARWVLVHDGARPCLTPILIARAVLAAKRHGAVVCGLPASLTVKDVTPRGTVRSTLERRRLWFAQTPQVFKRSWFARALTQVNGRLARFPDDASLIEAAGFPVRMVLGDPLNLKVTTREDLLLAEAILTQRRVQKSDVRRQTKTDRVFSD